MNPLFSYQNASWSLFLKIITTVGPLLACTNNLALADTAKTGSVSGIINFPGESVPKNITVCAEEVTNNNTICTKKSPNTVFYTNTKWMSHLGHTIFMRLQMLQIQAT